MQQNFQGKEIHDTVYVTANPYTPKLDQKVFHNIITAFDQWDDEIRTIPPEAVTEVASEAASQYPRKRVVVHYMQPHAPYIGEFGQSLYGNDGARGIQYVRSHDGKENIGEAPSGGVQLLEEVSDPDSELTEEDIVTAYQENLEIVMQSVSDLLPELAGKTVITSDHGELLGEQLLPFGKQLYGHPRFAFAEGLRTVPWLIPEFDKRKETEADPPEGGEEYDETAVKERLNAWGYAE